MKGKKIVSLLKMLCFLVIGLLIFVVLGIVLNFEKITQNIFQYDGEIIVVDTGSYDLNILLDEIYDDPELDLNLREKIEQKKYLAVLDEVFRLLGDLISKNHSNTDIIEYQDFAKQFNFSQLNSQELQENIKYLEDELKKIDGIRRKLFVTQLLSNAQDQVWVDQSLEGYELLAKQLSVGDMILLNKRKNLSLAANLLRDYQNDNVVDFVHVILVTEVGDSGIKFVHATIEKETGDGAGVEEYELEPYLKKREPVDFLVLEQSEEMRKKTVDFARSQIGKGYDYKVALASGIGVDQVLGDRVYENDLYNCAELITAAYEDDLIKKISHPNDFLDFGVFEMKYMGQLTINN